MPSKSKKQHNLMAAVANNPEFAEKVGIPQSVGEDYVEADRGRKFRSGGMAGCGTKRMKEGGMAKAKKTMRNLDDEIYRIDTEKAMEKRKMNKMAMGGKVKGYKAGGVTRGDGVCMKGHTKGRMV